ncbi:VWA domain-containing protein [Paenibacillus kobensis]|uniref:VWA domain-containing protein n=1 Tax=Paenibacillus kobensis TaxID=59841 RepID=UPI000FD8B848|nr:VWA domain-containing protein [Paenibacillus kobensis]
MIAKVQRLVFLFMLMAVVLLQACSSSGGERKADHESSAASTKSSTREDSKAANDTAASGEAAHTDEAAAAEEPTVKTENLDSSKEVEMDGASDEPRSNGNEPNAGILTAGEWDDNMEWTRWNDLMQSREGGEYMPYWKFHDFRRLEVRVTGAGKPVADAVVTLSRGNGQNGWTARTNASGTAYLFPYLFVEQGGSAKYSLKVTAGQQRKQFENVELKQGRVMEIKMDEATKPSDLVDLMLVVDTTGSMSDELHYLEAELKDVVTRVAKDNQNQLDLRISPNFYRDIYDDYTVKPYPFTRNVDEAVRQIADQEAFGGGDFPEAVEEAVEDAIDNHEWSQEALARLLFLVMDAPPHHEKSVVEQMQRLTERAAEEGIRIIPVASSGVDIATEHLMRYMAVATGGTYIFLTDHSGVGNGHLKPAVGEYEVLPLNDLLVNIINRYCRAA